MKPFNTTKIINSMIHLIYHNIDYLELGPFKVWIRYTKQGFDRECTCKNVHSWTKISLWAHYYYNCVKA